MASAIEQVRTRMGESVFISIANRTAAEAPELAYRLDQTGWAAAIRKLTTRALVD